MGLRKLPISLRSTIPQSSHLDPVVVIQGYRKMQKWLVLISGNHKHDPRTQTEPLEQNRASLGDRG